MQRQALLLAEQIPQRHLHGLVERQRGAALIAATRAVDTMHEAHRQLPFEPRPDLLGEDAGDLGLSRQGVEEVQDETEATMAPLVDQFQRRDIGVGDPHLAVADDPIARELEPRDLVAGDPHQWRSLVVRNSTLGLSRWARPSHQADCAR